MITCYFFLQEIRNGKREMSDEEMDVVDKRIIGPAINLVKNLLGEYWLAWPTCYRQWDYLNINGQEKNSEKS